MDNCIFCKIINGDIPSVKIYEDDHILAFLDISQATKGHTLIIPKKHVENVFELDEETATHVFKNVPTLANALRTALDAKGLNIINNNNEVAGQTVFHYHVHLIPRYDKNDGFKAIYTNNMELYSNDLLENISDQIVKELNKK